MPCEMKRPSDTFERRLPLHIVPKSNAKIYGWRERILLKVHRDLDVYLSARQGITLASHGLGWIGEPAFPDLLWPLLTVIGVYSERAVHAIVDQAKGWGCDLHSQNGIDPWRPFFVGRAAVWNLNRVRRPPSRRRATRLGHSQSSKPRTPRAVRPSIRRPGEPLPGKAPAPRTGFAERR